MIKKYGGKVEIFGRLKNFSIGWNRAPRPALTSITGHLLPPPAGTF
jgi:hypothetical protein